MLPHGCHSTRLFKTFPSRRQTPENSTNSSGQFLFFPASWQPGGPVGRELAESRLLISSADVKPPPLATSSIDHGGRSTPYHGHRLSIHCSRCRYQRDYDSNKHNRSGRVCRCPSQLGVRWRPPEGCRISNGVARRKSIFSSSSLSVAMQDHPLANDCNSSHNNYFYSNL